MRLRTRTPPGIHLALAHVQLFFYYVYGLIVLQISTSNIAVTISRGSASTGKFVGVDGAEIIKNVGGTLGFLIRLGMYSYYRTLSSGLGMVTRFVAISTKQRAKETANAVVITVAMLIRVSLAVGMISYINLIAIKPVA